MKLLIVRGGTWLAVLAAALCLGTAPLRAQDLGSLLPAVIGTGLGVGYVVLGIASIHRLADSGEQASVGTTVRLMAARPGRPAMVQGRLTVIDADSITVVVDNVPRRLARSEVRDMAVFAGTERKWAQGFGVGFLSGATIGALGGIASGDDPSSEWLSMTAKQKGMALGILGAVTGSAVGALIGTAVEGEHWKSVDRLPERATAIVAPTRSGALVGMRIRF